MSSGKSGVQQFVRLITVIAVLTALSWNHNWFKDPILLRSTLVAIKPDMNANVSTARNSTIVGNIPDGVAEDDRREPRLTKTVFGTGTRTGNEKTVADKVAGVTRNDYILSKQTYQNNTHPDEQGALDWQERHYLFSDENFFYAIHTASPDLERFLSHRAYMLGHQIEPDEAKVIAENNTEFGFIMGMQVVCPDCAKGLIFYEKNIAGHLMTVDEYRGVLNQPNFNQLIEASNSDDYVVSLYE